MHVPNNKSVWITLAAMLLVFANWTHSANTTETANLQKEGKQLIKQFATTLQPELKKALETGGPAAAIIVCSVRAPEIAAALSKKSGWTIKRVSLKPRNSPSAIPDAWEHAALLQLEDRHAKNDGTDSLVYSETLENEFRLIKVQLTKPLCLTCHGTQLTPKVTEALEKVYPDDEALAYSENQIRGAISLRKSLLE